MAQLLLMPLQTRLASILPGVDTVSLAVLPKESFFTPWDSSSRTQQPGSQLDLSELPAALSKASVTEDISSIYISSIKNKAN